MTADELRAICLANNISVSLTSMVREQDAATLLDVSTRTLRTWREYGEGPPCVRVNGWRYPLEGLAEFMTPPAETGRTRQKAEVCDIDADISTREDLSSNHKRLAQ